MWQHDWHPCFQAFVYAFFSNGCNIELSSVLFMRIIIILVGISFLSTVSVNILQIIWSVVDHPLLFKWYLHFHSNFAADCFFSHRGQKPCMQRAGAEETQSYTRAAREPRVPGHPAGVGHAMPTGIPVDLIPPTYRWGDRVPTVRCPCRAAGHSRHWHRL